MEDDQLSENLLSSLLSELPFGIILLEPDGEVLNYNRLALSLLNIDEVCILTDSFVDLIPSGALSQAVSEVARGRAARTRVETDIDDRSVSMRVQRLKVQGQSDKLVLIVEDVSRFRDLERIKSEFITDMLHRLRTPLTTIRSGLSILVSNQLGGLPEKVAKLVSISHGETERMILLVNDLRNLLLIESHQMVKMFDIKLHPIKEVVDGATAAVETVARDAEIKIEVEGLSGDITVSVDRGRAVEALTNVLHNAIVFSPGTGRVEVGCRREDGRVLLSVTDQGVGVSEGNVARITEKFFREDNDITRNVEGNGLGLYLAKSLVELMGGGIKIESSRGRGTKVELAFATGKEG